MKPRKPAKKAAKLFQYCIPEHRVEEVLKLHKDIDINEIMFEVGMSYRRMNRPVPEGLKALGVSIMREPVMTVEASGILTGSRTAMLKGAKEICKEMGLDMRHMRVRRMTISWKNNAMNFTRVTKNMEKPDGGTERQQMLGLVLRDDLDTTAVNEVIKRFSADKINCRYDISTTQTVVCSK